MTAYCCAHLTSVRAIFMYRELSASFRPIGFHSCTSLRFIILNFISLRQSLTKLKITRSSMPANPLLNFLVAPCIPSRPVIDNPTQHMTLKQRIIKAWWNSLISKQVL